MKFLRYAGSEDWWKWPEGGMTVYNINGGHHDINENSSRFMDGTVVEAEDWCELCCKMKYNPFKVDEPTRDMWIDPNGVMYDCGIYDGSHEMTAQKILEILYGEKVDYLDYAGDDLINYTWIKVTTSLMYELYEKEGMYNHMSDEQWKAYQWWREKFAARLP